MGGSLRGRSSHGDVITRRRPTRWSLRGPQCPASRRSYPAELGGQRRHSSASRRGPVSFPVSDDLAASAILGKAGRISVSEAISSSRAQIHDILIWETDDKPAMIRRGFVTAIIVILSDGGENEHGCHRIIQDRAPGIWDRESYIFGITAFRNVMKMRMYMDLCVSETE